MAESKGLLHEAKRLTTKARVKRDNAAGIQADAQFSTALNKLTSQFPGLQAQLKSRAAMKEAGIDVGPMPDLAKPAWRLRDQIVGYGRPTPQFLNSRSADVARLIETLQSQADEAWKSWAGEQIRALAVEPDLLQGPRGQALTDKLADLAQVAKRSFNSTDFAVFRLGADQVHDLIAELREPIRPDDVVARIDAGHGTLTFADLDDEEIDVLRHAVEAGRRVRLSIR